MLSSRKVKPIRTEILCDGNIVFDAYTARLNLRAVNLKDPEKQLLIAIVSKIQFFHPQSRASSLKGNNIERCCHFCDLILHIHRQKHIPTRRVEVTLQNYRLDVPCVVL